jgi:hypothetical protein
MDVQRQAVGKVVIVEGNGPAAQQVLHGAILGVPQEAWEPHPEEIRECADVPFVPGEKSVAW